MRCFLFFFVKLYIHMRIRTRFPSLVSHNTHAQAHTLFVVFFESHVVMRRTQARWTNAILQTNKCDISNTESSLGTLFIGRTQGFRVHYYVTSFLPPRRNLYYMFTDDRFTLNANSFRETVHITTRVRKLLCYRRVESAFPAMPVHRKRTICTCAVQTVKNHSQKLLCRLDGISF